MIWSIWNFFTKCIHRTPQNNVHFANSINRWSSFGSSVFHKNIHSKVPFKKNIHPKSGLKKNSKNIYNLQSSKKKMQKKMQQNPPRDLFFFWRGGNPKKNIKHNNLQKKQERGVVNLWILFPRNFVSNKTVAPWLWKSLDPSPRPRPLEVQLGERQKEAPPIWWWKRNVSPPWLFYILVIKYTYWHMFLRKNILVIYIYIYIIYRYVFIRIWYGMYI